jgi:hypothetical protein
MIKKLLAVIFSLILFTACEKDPPPAAVEYFSVSGRVMQKATLKPVGRCNIELGRFITASNDSGYYVFNNIPEGKYQLTAKKEGYSDFSQNITLTWDPVINIDMIPTKEQVLTGKIFNILNNPVSGASVTCEGKTTITDSSGSFLITGIQEGTHLIKVTYSNYNDFIEELAMPSGTKDVVIRLKSSFISNPVKNTRYTDGNYSNTIKWDPLVFPTLAGYNLYYRKAYVWKIAKDGYSYVYTPDWTKLNQKILTRTEFIHNTDEFNVNYSYYVMPVNIDGQETSPENAAPTVLEIPASLNYQVLNTISFSADSTAGPFTIPMANASIIMRMNWRYDLWNAGLAEWNLFISQDSINWTLLKNFMTGNEYGGLYCWQLDMYQYVGKTIYLRYDGEIGGYISHFSISQFNK